MKPVSVKRRTPRASWLEGVARIFDIHPFTNYHIHSNEEAFHQDAKALSFDWYEVGQDFKFAIKKVKTDSKAEETINPK
jgi:hypothetical protein